MRDPAEPVERTAELPAERPPAECIVAEEREGAADELRIVLLFERVGLTVALRVGVVRVGVATLVCVRVAEGVLFTRTASERVALLRVGATVAVRVAVPRVGATAAVRVALLRVAVETDVLRVAVPRVAVVRVAADG